jgi:hypothetical protein
MDVEGFECHREKKVSKPREHHELMLRRIANKRANFMYFFQCINVGVIESKSQGFN